MSKGNEPPACSRQALLMQMSDPMVGLESYYLPQKKEVRDNVSDVL